MTLSEQEAFEAMYAFLAGMYERTQSDELGALLGSLSLLPDRKPADPAMWTDWLKCVQKAKNGEVRTDLGLT